MSLALRFHLEAQAELNCIIGDYEARLAGLGSRFRDEVENICKNIADHSLQWRQRPEGYRRVNLPGFPYFVAYVIEAETIYIVAISHTSRDPAYFRQRLP